MTQPLSKEPFLLAVDPGEGTGWVILTKQGMSLDAGITRTREELYDWLDTVPTNIEVVVMEDYRVFNHKAVAHAGSKLETARVIGVIEEWAHRHKATLVLQPANILPIAKLWTGIKPKGAHKDQHHISAILHGLYYLQKEGYVQPKRR